MVLEPGRHKRHDKGNKVITESGAEYSPPFFHTPKGPANKPLRAAHNSKAAQPEALTLAQTIEPGIDCRRADGCDRDPVGPQFI